ncbi:MAG: YqgE/AlgH family protein [Flavobacteriales bacterium]|nr:YqgE/AlgH family protein [Flavobacteriales bacterium]
MSSIIKTKPKKGGILISQPLINDDYFHNSVVFLSEYSKEGVVGFIVNKPLRFSINDLIDDFPHFDTTVYYGGPVEASNLYFIHRVPDKIKGSIPITNELYWGGNFGQIKDLILTDQLKPDDIRFFLGYSGWEETQLDEEIAKNSWIVDKLKDTLFEWNIKKLWKDCIKETNTDFQLWVNAPKDIRLN